MLNILGLLIKQFLQVYVDHKDELPCLDLRATEQRWPEVPICRVCYPLKSLKIAIFGQTDTIYLYGL